jgi:hypothetical protein
MHSVAEFPARQNLFAGLAGANLGNGCGYQIFLPMHRVFYRKRKGPSHNVTPIIRQNPENQSLSG